MEHLKELRQSCHLSQQKLADEFHISQQSVWKYENNLAEPDINMLMRLANYFDVSVDYLIGNANTPAKADTISETQLTPIESAVIQNFRSVSGKMQKIIFELLKEAAESSDP